jgi:hypothetical protein
MAPRSPINRSSQEATRMKTQTLFTAFAIAQTRRRGAPSAPARFDPGPTDDSTLLTALRNSATDRDQIIQRRIGMITEATNHM